MPKEFGTQFEMTVNKLGRVGRFFKQLGIPTLIRDPKPNSREVVDPLRVIENLVSGHLPRAIKELSEQGHNLEFGNIFSDVAQMYTTVYPQSREELVEARLAVQPDFNWEDVMAVTKRVAERFNVAVPDYGNMKYEQVVEGYKSEAELIADLEAQFPTEDGEETIEVYRGVRHPDWIQFASGLRNWKLRYGVLKDLPPTFVSYLNGNSIKSINNWRQLELTENLAYTRLDCLSNAPMLTSAHISTSHNKEFTSEVAPYVITAKVPKRYTVDLAQYDKLRNTREQEVAVQGWINPAWITNIERSGTYRKMKEAQINISPEDLVAHLDRDKVFQILQSEDYDPKILLAELKKDPTLTALFESSAYVSEGYSIEEHSLVAANLYEQNFSKKPLPTFQGKPVPTEFYRLLLIGHDLGKPISQSTFGNINVQHHYGEAAIKTLAEWVGFDDQLVELAGKMVNQDYIGDYIKPVVHYPQQTSLDLFHMCVRPGRFIVEKAVELGIEPKEMFDLLSIYYRCDAGAYTKFGGGIESLDSLFEHDAENNSLDYSQKIHYQMTILDRYIQGFRK